MLILYMEHVLGQGLCTCVSTAVKSVSTADKSVSTADHPPREFLYYIKTTNLTKQRHHELWRRQDAPREPLHADGCLCHF